MNVEDSLFEVVLELESEWVEYEGPEVGEEDERSPVSALPQGCPICVFRVEACLHGEPVGALQLCDQALVLCQSQFLHHQLAVEAALLPLLFQHSIWQVRVFPQQWNVPSVPTHTTEGSFSLTTKFVGLFAGNATSWLNTEPSNISKSCFTKTLVVILFLLLKTSPIKYSYSL